MTFLGFTDKSYIYPAHLDYSKLFMLTLIDQNLLSTKTDHYWKYSKHSEALGNHIEWIIENIKDSKDGHIRVRINDFIKELGHNFARKHYTSIFVGLKYALFKDGVIIDIGKHIDGDDIFIMRFVNNDDKPTVNQYMAEKSRRKCRNKDLDPDSSKGFGYMTEILTAKFLGTKTCFDMTGNFNYRYFDIYQHEDFGRINVKGSKLLYYKGCYHWIFNTKKNKTPDFFFCIGYNDTRTEVLCVYIIPNENILTHTIHINKNWSQDKDPYYWHKQDPKPWNDLFHTLKLEDCPVLKTRS